MKGKRIHKSKKCRHVKLIKIEVGGKCDNNTQTKKNASKQDEEKRMNENCRKNGSDVKRLARNNR